MIALLMEIFTRGSIFRESLMDMGSIDGKNLAQYLLENLCRV